MVGANLTGNEHARHRLYVWIAVAIAAWVSAILWFAIRVVRLDVYWMSYYAADYTQGFVRRGLAGELAGLVPGHYFAVTLGLRWLSTSLYLCGLAAVAGVVLFRRHRWSERRLMVAMLIPLLPFGLPFAAYSARPDLFGGAALALFSSALVFARSRAAAMAWCVTYGLVMAALTLVHEAIGLEFAVGTVLAIVVLGGALKGTQRLGILLAVLPGALTAAAVAAFGRHDVASRLCASLPHRLVQNPFATVTSPTTLLHYVIDGRASQTDYHDWVCRNVLPSFDRGIADAVRSVGHIGVVGLTMSLVFGVVGIVLTVWGVGEISGVPPRAFAEELRGRWTWVSAGLLLILPVFLTGFDWTRWLIIVAFDVGVVFMLYAAHRPEIEQEPTRKALRWFLVLAVVLALIPIGTVPGFGGPRMV